MNSIAMLLALPATTVLPAQADAASPNEPQIVVEGSRIETPVAVIVSPDPADTALPPNALDLLDTLPDVRAVSTGGAGGTSFVSIRGGEPNFAQILINGVQVANPSSSQGGGFDFAQLDPALIASVAVVPSSRSAVYGSDALSGVIAIRLTEPVAGRTRIGGALTADTDEDYSAAARLDYGWNGGGVVLAVGQSETGALREGSTIDRRQALAHVVQDIGGWNLSAFALLGDSERAGFPGSSGGPLFAANRALEQRNTRFLATGFSAGAPDSAAVRPALRSGYYDDNVAADTPAIFPGVFSPVPALTSDTDYDRLQIAGDIRFRASENLDLLVGADFQRERASSSGTIEIGFPLPTFFAIEREQVSAFAEAAWRPVPGLKLTAAGRADFLRKTVETTAQATLDYSPGDSGLTLFAAYGEGFHLPSLFALAFPLTANPDLRPERSVSWEGGARWQRGATTIRASAFHTDYTDLIDFDPVLFTTVNRLATSIGGASVSGEGTIGPQIEWNGSLTLLDFDSEVPLRSRPDWYGHARIAWRPVEAWRIGGAATFNSDFLETSVPTGVIELDGHVALDLFADWQASEQLTLSLALRNATGAEWQDAVGFAAPGRVLRARIGFAF